MAQDELRLERMLRDGRETEDEYQGIKGRCRRSSSRNRKIIFGDLATNHDGSNHHVLILDDSGPKIHVQFKERAYGAWIADEDSFAVALGCDEGLEVRFFDVDGTPTGKRIWPYKWLTFLGLSETGSHCAWEYQRRLHITETATNADYLEVELPFFGAPNLARFNSAAGYVDILSDEGLAVRVHFDSGRWEIVAS